MNKQPEKMRNNPSVENEMKKREEEKNLSIKKKYDESSKNNFEKNYSKKFKEETKEENIANTDKNVLVKNRDDNRPSSAARYLRMFMYVYL
jgi:hypothetical protein